MFRFKSFFGYILILKSCFLFFFLGCLFRLFLVFRFLFLFSAAILFPDQFPIFVLFLGEAAKSTVVFTVVVVEVVFTVCSGKTKWKFKKVQATKCLKLLIRGVVQMLLKRNGYQFCDIE